MNYALCVAFLLELCYHNNEVILCFLPMKRDMKKWNITDAVKAA